MAIRSFRDLEVWRRSIQLVKKVYTLTDGFPNSERYGLVSQMQRAAVSVPANIAEGCARESTGDFIRFLAIAKGSLAELETMFVICEEIQYCNNQHLRTIQSEASEIGRMLTGLQQKLRRRKQQI